MFTGIIVCLFNKAKPFYIWDNWPELILDDACWFNLSYYKLIKSKFLSCSGHNRSTLLWPYWTVYKYNNQAIYICKEMTFCYDCWNGIDDRTDPSISEQYQYYNPNQKDLLINMPLHLAVCWASLTNFK